MLHLETDETEGESPYRGRAKGLRVKKVVAGSPTNTRSKESSRSQALRKIRDDLRSLREQIIADAKKRPKATNMQEAWKWLGNSKADRTITLLAKDIRNNLEKAAKSMGTPMVKQEKTRATRRTFS